ncbi:MAG: Hpt domain-containing protein, partial [Deltaproteobacteria bacterium]|nr:Hpt domain-containing protein [Deltaproteobacteria bacterium]
MSKYKALFTEQSREHLSELSQCFVRLETAADPAPVIDEIFRHAHSIKGMAGSMHYEPIVALAHRMEDVMGAVRSGKMALAPDLIDLLLKTVDSLAAQVEQVVADKDITTHEELVEALRESLSEEPATAATKTPAKKRGKAAAGGRRILVTLAPDCKAAAVRLFLVHRKLSEMGKVLESTPTPEAMRRGQVSELEAEMVFDGTQSEAVVREALLSLPEVHSVTFDGPHAEPERKVRRGKKAAAEAPPEPT